VFDKSGMSMNMVPVLMYAPENLDFTSDVVAALNKPGRPSSPLAGISPATTASPAPKKP